MRILVFAQREGVEAALGHEEEMVVQDIADCAQLALEAVALAQKPRNRVAAAVAELGEVHGDEREALHVSGERFRPFVGIEPYAELAGVSKEILAAREPKRERNDDIAARRNLGQFALRPALKQTPAVRDDAPLFDQRCHIRIP